MANTYPTTWYNDPEAFADFVDEYDQTVGRYSFAHEGDPDYEDWLLSREPAVDGDEYIIDMVF